MIVTRNIFLLMITSVITLKLIVCHLVTVTDNGPGEGLNERQNKRDNAEDSKHTIVTLWFWEGR